jgi:hypothetical protein
MQGQVQQFASQPQAVRSRGPKYRDEMDASKNNIMHDKRVVRGNTYASMVEPKQDMGDVQKQREAQRRRLMRANQTKKRAGTPEPTPGRKHMDIQTDSYLEELTERTVEFEAETQTDFLLDRPPSPLFMPAKIGVDVDTQIMEGDLFDFDQEVEPVLEVLVGKTLEQSMMEVLEEEELESLRRHQEDFEKRRNAEMLVVQRMEAAEKRRQDEMERRMQQAQAQREQDLSVMKKVISRSVAASHLSSLRDRALAHLLDAGVFASSIEGAVDSKFMPDLLKQVTSQMQQSSADRNVVGAVMQSTMQSKLDAHKKVLQSERDRLAAIDAAEKQARIEAQQERLRLEAERQRIENEQKAMIEWEQWQPPPPPAVTVASVGTEEPIKATTVDGQEYPIIADKLPELAAMLDGLPGMDPPKIVVASVLDDSNEESPTYPQYLDDFRLEDKPAEDTPAVDDAAAAAAGGDDA